MTAPEAPGLLLRGLDGSNPLGFLAAVGAAVVAKDLFPTVRFGWQQAEGGWRPSFSGCGDDEQGFSEMLFEALGRASMAAFDFDNKMPFDADRFSDALREIHAHSSIADRRDADFLASFGTELYPDEKTGQFQDSKFRMVRSGDSAGQGLPFYAKALRGRTTLDCIRRAVFCTWDYQDEGYSLRWDPIEDQRYALRWRDPSRSSIVDGPGTMLAANSLAIEALRWFPTLLIGKQAWTTGFRRVGRREIYFVWPIWTPMVDVETLRSLLTLDDLAKSPIPRLSLVQRGIPEVYRSQRIQQNQYYSNFTAGVPAP